MFNERYVSDVVLDPNTSVSATSKDTKLLESLHTHWEFKPAKNPKHCWINFKVEFQFKSKIYNELAGIFMDEVASKMVEYSKVGWRPSQEIDYNHLRDQWHGMMCVMRADKCSVLYLM